MEKSDLTKNHWENNWMKIYFSYNPEDSFLIKEIYEYLCTQPNFDISFWEIQRELDGNRPREILNQTHEPEVFILFWRNNISEIQEIEIKTSKQIPTIKKRLVVNLGDLVLPEEQFSTQEWSQIVIDEFDETLLSRECSENDRKKFISSVANEFARKITEEIGRIWFVEPGLPSGYPFVYEKHVIEEYLKGNGNLSEKYVEKGCCKKWPTVVHQIKSPPLENPVKASDIGAYRDIPSDSNDVQMKWRTEEDWKSLKSLEPQVNSAALVTKFDPVQLKKYGLTFPEAGPRKYHYYPIKDSLTVGIIVSGGIAPGINAVISGIVKRHFLYAGKEEGRSEIYNIEILGFNSGFSGFLQRSTNLFTKLTPNQVETQTNLGGSILGTSRTDELLDPHPKIRLENLLKVYDQIAQLVDILYIIGGDGSMRAAHMIWKKSQENDKKHPLSVITIPKTMDNDILWVWQSFGFLSAVERAKNAIQVLETEARSNPRLCIIQLFGSDSGFVASHAAIASGVCDVVLIPEIEFSMDDLFNHLKIKLENKRKKHSGGLWGVIVMAETAIPTDIDEYIASETKKYDLQLTSDELIAIKIYKRNNRRVFGQTPDALRSAGLKVVSYVLQQKINEMKDDCWKNFRVFTNEPRHLIRAIPPSSSDIIFANRLGSLAVDCAMAGYTDFMISQWLTEYVMIPLDLVVLGKKRIPKEGIFWKSVIANTGQPANLDTYTSKKRREEKFIVAQKKVDELLNTVDKLETTQEREQ